jgi:DNA-binding PadR family transcriptional regulator
MLFDEDRSPRMGGQAAGHGRARGHHDEGPGPGRFRGPGMFGGPRMHGVGGPARFGFGGPFGGRGRMARRGDVRTAILALLAEKPMHGYQVIQELEARSEGRWRPSAGSIYPTLQQLEDEGLVRSQEIDGRRVFSLTDAGSAETARRSDRPGAPWQSVGPAGDDANFDLRRLVAQVAAAAVQVSQVGSARSQDQARDILADARRRLYRLLAEDESAEETAENDPVEG